MNTFKFSLLLLKREKKKALTLGITIIFAIASTLLFFDMTQYDIVIYQEAEKIGFPTTFSMIFGFIVIILCAMMIINAYLYFLNKKTKELAIMGMSGSTTSQSTIYLIIQTLIIVVISAIPGFVIGYVMCVASHYMFNMFLDTKVLLWHVSGQSFFNTILTIIMILICITVYASGYVYRHDILVLLNSHYQKQIQDKRLLRFPHWFYVGVYILGIVILLMSENTASIIFGSCVGIMGAGGIVQYIIPKLLMNYKNRKAKAHKIQFISLSFLSQSLQQGRVMISVYCIFVVTMLSILMSQSQNQRYFMIVMIGYFIVAIMTAMSIMYKFISDAALRKNSIYGLYKLGYSQKQLLKIVSQEVSTFFGWIFLVVAVYEVLSVTMSCLQGLLSLRLGIILLIIVQIPIVCVTIATHRTYRKSILQVLKEGVHYE